MRDISWCKTLCELNVVISSVLEEVEEKKLNALNEPPESIYVLHI